MGTYITDRYTEDKLQANDKQTVDILKDTLYNLLHESVISDYVNDRKEVCDWGTIQTMTMCEQLEPFLRYLKERANELTYAYVVRTIDDYDNEEITNT